MESRQLYLVGYGLGLVGSLAAVAAVVLAGAVSYAVIMLGATVTFVLGIYDGLTREDFDRDHSLAYRVGNLGGAILVVGLGLLMLAVGIVSLVTFPQLSA